MTLLQRIVAAAAVVLAAAGFKVNSTGLPAPVERAAITAALMVMTPEMEGTKYRAYPDTGGVWTICTGHTGGVVPGDTATPEQCAAYLQDDLAFAVDFVMKTVPAAPFLCKVSLADMVYNAGRAAVAKSSMVRLFKAGDPAGAAHAFMKWVYVSGQNCMIAASNCYGIVKRRMLQRDLCLEGVA